MAAYISSTKTESLTSGVLNLTLPTVPDGSLLVAYISGHAGTNSTILWVDAPPGWTKLDDASGADNLKLYAAVFAKIWHTGDPTTQAWQVQSSANCQGSHIICAGFSGPGPIEDMNLSLAVDSLNTLIIPFNDQLNAAIVILASTHSAGDANATIPDLISGFTSINTEQTAGSGNYTHSSRLQYRVVNGDLTGIPSWTETSGDTCIGGSMKIPFPLAAGGGLFWANNF